MLVADGDGDVDCVSFVVVVEFDVDDAFFDALWILCPKINDDVPIKKETADRIFPVMPGINASGAP